MSDQIPPSRGTTSAQLAAMHLEAEAAERCARCCVGYVPTETHPGGTTAYGRLCPACYQTYLSVILPIYQERLREIANIVKDFMERK